MKTEIKELVKRLYYAKHISIVQDIVYEKFNIKLTKKEIKEIAKKLRLLN